MSEAVYDFILPGVHSQMPFIAHYLGKLELMGVEREAVKREYNLIESFMRKQDMIPIWHYLMIISIFVTLGVIIFGFVGALGGFAISLALSGFIETTSSGSKWFRNRPESHAVERYEDFSRNLASKAHMIPS
ncbi:Hypothetical protein POVR1_LOCUS361 [uncultured virus]|nr:Hypothetical protein POVR1_LOCUS361 [uncultured virus]